MIDLGELGIKLSVDDTEGSKGLQQFAEDAETTGNKFEGVSNKIKTLAAGLAVGVVVKKGFDMAKQAVTEFADKGDDIDKMSQKFSMSAESYQQWESIAGHNGTSMAIVGKAIKEITTSAQDNAQAYEDMGIKMKNTDGSMRDSQDIFKDTILALSDMEAGTERDAKAKELLGGKYQELLPLINGGRDAILEQLEASKDAVVMTDEQVKAAAAYKDAQQALQEQINKVKMVLMEKLVPALVTLMDWITEHMPEIQKIVDDVVSFIGGLIDGLSAMISALVESAQKDGTYFNTVWKGIQIVFTTVFKALQDIFTIFTAVFTGDWEGAWNGVKTLFADVWEGIKALFINNLKGIINILKGMVGAFKDVGVNLIKGLWNGINSVKQWIYDKIKGFVNGITDVVKAFFGIHSPSLVFKEIGKYLVEGLAIGIEENASFAADEMEKLCTMILGQADEISTGILEKDAKTGQLVMNSTYKNIEEKIKLYYKDRDVRIATMDKATQANIKNLQKDVKATEDATKAQIELYNAVFRAKSQAIDDETNEAVSGLQKQLDAIDKAEEKRSREKDSTEYDTKLSGLYDKLNTTSGDENLKVVSDIEQLKSDRKETLRKQDLADEKDSIKVKMDEARAEANKKKKLLEEELKQKTYNLEQQRNKEIEHMNKVIELMQIQVDKKAELEKIQTEIKDKEKKLQTKNIDKETKLQTKNELSELKKQEKNLKTSLSEGEKNLENFTPKILEISRGYGDVMLSGFKSTEGNILSYVDSLCDEIRRRIKAASKAKKADGSHRTGLDYVPFDNYAAVLHKGEMVLTQAEADRYKKGESSVKNDSNITQNFYGVKEERTAFEVSRQTKKTIRQLGLA